jgi:hypothetical protein
MEERMNAASQLDELRADFLANATLSMPIAGVIFWGIVALASLRLNPNALALLVLFGSGMIFPLGVLIDRLRGRTMRAGTGGNPVMEMFLQSLALVVLVWPLVIFSAGAARDANLFVLGGAILMGIVWIPYGWAADDRTGIEHAIGRGVLCYIAFVFVPAPYKALAISVAVMLAYLYSLARMKRPPIHA